MRYALALFLLLSSAASAQSVSLTSYINTQLPNNTSRTITAANVRNSILAFPNNIYVSSTFPISTSSYVSAVTYFGDGSHLKGITGGSSTTPGGVSASVQVNNGTTNSLYGDSFFTYISGLLQVPSISATNISVTGPISASTYYGDGSHLSGISAGISSYNSLTNVPVVLANISNSTGSVTVTSINAATGTFTNIGGTITQAAQGNITSLGTLTGLTSSGTVSANVLDSFILSSTSINGTSANLSGGLTTGAVVASGNISAATFTGNGAALTGVSASSVAYGNVTGVPVGVQNIANGTGSVTVTSIAATNIAGTLTQAAQGNITSVGTLTGLTVNGIITATNYISASTYFGDGSHLTGISGGSSTLPSSPVNSVQFNNAGAFGGSASFTWNGSLVSATAFKGDGSQLTGIAGSSSPSWYAVTNIPTVLQNISNSTGSVTVTSINAVNGAFSGTITPTVYGINIATTGSNTQALYISGTSMDGALGLAYFNNPNWVTIGTQTGNSPVTPNDALQITGGIAMTGSITGTTLISTSAGGTVSGTNLYARAVSGSTGTFGAITVGSCTGCGGGGSSISTTQNAAGNISGSIGVGFNALVGTGVRNSSFGANAMVSNTTGTDNTAFGYNSLPKNANSGSNSSFGSQAMLSYNDSSGNNAAFGVTALSGLVSGSSNTGMGSNALGSVGTGSLNTSLGSGAGGTLVSGSSNLMLGASSAPFNTTGSNQLSIQNIIYGDLGRALNGRIGVNVTSPTASFEVSGTISATNINTSGTLVAQNVTVLGTCTNCGTGAGGGTNISTTQSAASNISRSFAVGPNASVGTGLVNTAFSAGAGQALTSGVSNTFVGSLAGNKLTTGSKNTALGAGALRDNVTGSEATAIGDGALQVFTGGNNPTAVGAFALGKSTSGDNVAVGDQAALNLTTGSANVFIGDNSGLTITANNNNTAVGLSAMQNLDASDNSVFGNNALQAATGASVENAIFGYNAMSAAAGVRSFNSVFGSQAALAVTTGSSNTILGYKAGVTLTTGSNNLIIGAGSDVQAASGSNQLNITNAIYGDTGRALNSFVGINVVSPTASLEVSGTISGTFVGNASALSAANTQSVTILTASGTFTTPANSKTTTGYKITLTGGGGGAGGCGAIANAITGGGGGAGTTIYYASGIAPSTALTVTVGTGGTGGTTGTVNGNNGTSSTIVISSTTYTAGYGNGSAANNIGANSSGGNGGIAVGGSINLSGTTGGLGITLQNTGAGGESYWGTGPQPVLNGQVNGINASNYGAGGSGCASSAGVGTQTGGTGKSGIAVIEYVL